MGLILTKVDIPFWYFDLTIKSSYVSVVVSMIPDMIGSPVI